MVSGYGFGQSGSNIGTNRAGFLRRRSDEEE
jgi:hypothetical protein